MTALTIIFMMFSYNAGIFKNHITVKNGDSEMYIKFEAEDPSVIVKTSGMGESYYQAEPVNGQFSHENSSEVTTLTVTVTCFIFFAMTVYQAVFFGRLYRNGVIKNLIIAGISKHKIFISSFILSELLLVFFSLLSVGIIALTNLIYGGYMIIYLPSYLMCIAVSFLILSFMSTLVLTVVFLSQNQMISLILPVVFALLIVSSVSPVIMEQAGIRPYKESPEAAVMLLDGETEFFFDADSLGRDLYVEGKYVDIYDHNQPDESYPGDSVHNILMTVHKSNILSYPMMMTMFEYHAIARDGLAVRYIILSTCYTAALFAVGCIIAKKRNIE